MREVRDGVDRRQSLDEGADQHGVGDGADAGTPAERPGEQQDREAHGDVGHPERQARVLREALVQHVPGR